MDYFFITGASRGIGKAVAQLILEKPNTYVFGISRTESIVHHNYTHINVDLSKEAFSSSFDFPLLKEPSAIVLINNSGMLGQVKKIGKGNTSDIAATFRLNIIAPAILMQKFTSKYQDFNLKKTIINISSGLARYPMASWADYCASKAALDMYSLVFGEEQKKIDVNKRISIHSVAPGIVDTQMQAEIRKVPISDFENVDRFIQYKEKEQLWPPEKTATKILNLIYSSQTNNEVLLDVRQL
jgi:benzil reductase ((S)-benzoin forming)